MSHRVFLSLGSNHQRAYHFMRCQQLLKTYFKPIQYSPIYASDAFGIQAAPFWNQVIHVDTSLAPAALYACLKHIECACGRTRKPQSGPVQISLDIDLLLYDKHCTDTPCPLPRAEILTRSYILKPLCDLIGSEAHPSTHKTYAEHWRRLDPKIPVLHRLTEAQLQKEPVLCHSSKLLHWH